VPVGLDFGGRAELAGYDLAGDPADRRALTLTLVWRGLAEMTDSYRVFVHVLDEEGQIVAQSDAEPAGWSRPTTGWLAGEYVVDQHLLQLPEGVSLSGLSLRIGLYEGESGDRLPTAVGDAFTAPLVGLDFKE